MRADVYLTEHGYTTSRTRAADLIKSGSVMLDGQCVTRASMPVSDGVHVIRIVDLPTYVGRGGLKLEAALDAFQIHVLGCRAIDIGASTGGFTDCLLQRGASLVFAVDAGVGQLAPKLQADDRVVSREHLNARTLVPTDLDGEPADLIVMDVSFISATYILPQFPALLSPTGCAVCLVKPQFEVGRELLGKGGIVRSSAAHCYAIQRVCECAASVGLHACDLIPSPILGGDGNREFLLYIRRVEPAGADLNAKKIRAIVEQTNPN